MPWRQLTIETEALPPEELEAALEAIGALSVTAIDAGDEPIYEPDLGTTPFWSQVRLTALFPYEANEIETLLRLCAQLGVAKLPSHRFETLDDQVWDRAWMDAYQPIQCGKRLWVCPSHCAPPDASAINIRLDPGLAFGTGTHPTTRLCLEWLAEHDLTRQHILDYGCGSGILAIGAALLGASQVWAVDIDPQALTATDRNAALNGVSARLEAMHPDSLPMVTADAVVANILAGPLQRLEARLAEYTKPHGQIVLSGILERQASAVIDSYQMHFNLVSTKISEGWARIELQRRAT